MKTSQYRSKIKKMSSTDKIYDGYAARHSDGTRLLIAFKKEKIVFMQLLIHTGKNQTLSQNIAFRRETQ